jgi:hypothetical protein
MGALINVGINLDKLDKSRIVKNKSGNFYNITVSVNDTPNEWGKNASVFNQQSVEEYTSKAEKQYVGNGKVVWTDGTIVAAPRDEQQTQAQPKAEPAGIDLPF